MALVWSSCPSTAGAGASTTTPTWFTSFFPRSTRWMGRQHCGTRSTKQGAAGEGQAAVGQDGGGAARCRHNCGAEPFRGLNPKEKLEPVTHKFDVVLNEGDTRVYIYCTT